MKQLTEDELLQKYYNRIFWNDVDQLMRLPNVHQHTEFANSLRKSFSFAWFRLWHKIDCFVDQFKDKYIPFYHDASKFEPKQVVFRCGDMIKLANGSTGMVIEINTIERLKGPIFVTYKVSYENEFHRLTEGYFDESEIKLIQ